MAIYEIKEENGKFIVINEDEKAKPEKIAIQAKSHIDNFYKHCLRWANSRKLLRINNKILTQVD